MSLYIVHKKNPYFKQGETIELFTDGFQRCVMSTSEYRMKVETTTGIFVPERLVKPYCIKLLRRGFDKPGLRTRRTEYGH